MLAGIYLKVKGNTQGEIKGSVVQEGHDGKIHILAFKNDYDMPARLQEGLTPAAAARGTITLTKEMDRSSPQFLQALGKREMMEEFEITIHRPKTDTTGGDLTELLFTYKFAKVLIIHMDQYSPTPHKDDSNGIKEGLLGYIEEIKFAYSGYSLEHAESGITGAANWTDG
ncbi:type VI secretion system effector Hcp1 [Burkholderia pseudomallei]|uniref:type VI secretion system effector Hcp1 n=1 Tax=Burkholderia pseudomallei TaxID=28450 RepID=UPI000E68A3D6|nr:type VI secretion system effector Hcp1 [Burkholderia pseudomallei]RIV65875.1 Hcp family type VI secretion system effector [Burkholderia pseudomallei]RIV79922.1 Hcp family type VI secretion system effector [Burkholderia pseudomallei]